MGGNVPDGLVGNDNLSPLLLGELLGSSVELAGHNLKGLVGLTLLCCVRLNKNFFPRGVCGGMTYLESLTNAEDDREAIVNGKLGLAGNELVHC